MEDNDLLRKFKVAFKDAESYRRSWDKDAKRAFAFYASDQWSPEDKAQLKEELRPAATFNNIKKFVHVVSGSEIVNRYEPRYFPRSVDAMGYSDKVTEVSRFMRDRSNAEQHDSAAFRDMCICGIGCNEFFQDYETSVEGETMQKRVPVFEMYWDPSARETNLLDASYIIREKWINEGTFKAMWPEKVDEFFGTINFGASPINPTSPEETTRTYSKGANGAYDFNQKKVLVSEYQWYEVETRFFVELFQGPQMVQSYTLENDEVSSAQTKLEEIKNIAMEEGLTLKQVKLPHRRYKRAFFAGDLVLEQGPTPVNDFTYKFLTGFENMRNDLVYWQGLVADLEDPQMWTNKFYSQMIHIFSTNPKGAIIAKPGLFSNPEKARKEWAKPNAFLVANYDPKDSMEIVHGQMPQGLEYLFSSAQSMMNEISGINPSYFIPSADNLTRTANTAIQSIQRQSLVVLSILFDSLRLYRKEQGRVMLKFIKEFVPDGMIVQLTDKMGMMQPMPFDRTWIEKAEYDVIVDESPTSPSMRHELWSSLVQTNQLETLIGTGLLTPDIIADIIPNITEDVRQRMKQNAANMMAMQQQMMEGGGGQPPPV